MKNGSRTTTCLHLKALPVSSNPWRFSVLGYLVAAFALSSCGGGGTSNSTTSAPVSNNLATLGKDTDANGIWDDLDLRVQQEFSSNASERSAALRYANALQQAVVIGQTGAAISSENIQISKAVTCVFQVFGPGRFGAVVDGLEQQATNSEQRVRAYMHFMLKAPSFTLSYDRNVDYCLEN